MAHFRKKPVVIEAFLYRADGPTPVPEWFNAAIARGDAYFTKPGASAPLAIKTLEGVMTAQPGDYIIQGVKGEIYPCKPDIFAATYDSADEPSIVENDGNEGNAPSGWISVLDKLPEPMKNMGMTACFLVTVSAGDDPYYGENRSVTEAFYRFDSGQWFNAGSGLMIQTVTHWMPIPAPAE